MHPNCRWVYRLFMGLLRPRQIREYGWTPVCVPDHPVTIKETACPEQLEDFQQVLSNFTCWNTRQTPPVQLGHTLLHVISWKLWDSKRKPIQPSAHRSFLLIFTTCFYSPFYSLAHFYVSEILSFPSRTSQNSPITLSILSLIKMQV
jgi:hypothetical protein